MLPERRHRLITILWRLVVWPVAVLAAAVVGFSAYAVLTLAPLAPWHSLELKEEFEARPAMASCGFWRLLALEGRLFDELRHAKVLQEPRPGRRDESSRFSPGSWVARLTRCPGGRCDSGDVYTAPYSRTFELVPAEGGAARPSRSTV